MGGVGLEDAFYEEGVGGMYRAAKAETGIDPLRNVSCDPVYCDVDGRGK